MGTNINSGTHILHDPRLNKGTAFTEDERDRLGLRGLLPPHTLTQDEQCVRVMDSFHAKPNDLEQHIYLMGLYDRNERLFYRVVQENLEELVPVLYTPTVGEACRRFSHIYRRPRGIYVTANDRGRIAGVLRNWPDHDIRVIVVTDGERILGLGDLGAGGMGIPIGKLVLYTACAGIDPAQTLPVMFDVGSNNEEVRNDPLYIGLAQPRIDPTAYDELFEEFIAAVTEVFPRAMIQCEDFANRNARRLLEAYRDKICMFNDDMQGTAAVALAGLLTAGRVTGAGLADQRILFVGSGTAGTGIADLVVVALESEGLSCDDARKRCWFFDTNGLVVKGRVKLKTETLPYAHVHEEVGSLAEVVRTIRPTALVGVSGQPGLFNREVIEAMTEANQRPIVFPLSNPTSRAECSAEQAYRWSDGRAVVATGSPFGPVEVAGKRLVPRQGNNAYIFPGLGLGVIVSGTTGISDAMFHIAARVLARAVPEADLEQGSIYPRLADVRPVSVEIAHAVAIEAFASGTAGVARPSDLRAAIESAIYDPSY